VYFDILLMTYDFTGDVVYFLFNSLTPGGFQSSTLQLLAGIAIVLPPLLFTIYLGFLKRFAVAFLGALSIALVTLLKVGKRSEELFIRSDCARALYEWQTLDRFVGWVITRSLYVISIPFITVFGLATGAVFLTIWSAGAVLLITTGISLKWFALERFTAFYRLWMSLGQEDASPAEEQQTLMLNASVFFELFFESIPEMAIIFVNEQLKPPEARWRSLAWMEMTSSAAITLREIWPVVRGILFAKCGGKSFREGLQVPHLPLTREEYDEVRGRKMPKAKQGEGCFEYVLNKLEKESRRPVWI